jgi:hypothetical protein
MGNTFKKSKKKQPESNHAGNTEKKLNAQDMLLSIPSDISKKIEGNLIKVTIK